MAAFTSIALGIGAAAGLGSMGYGMYQQAEGREQAERGYAMQQQGAMIQGIAAQGRAQVARDQADTSVQFAQRNLLLEQQASADSFEASRRSQLINQSTIQAELRNEELRRQAMELDGRRKSLEIIRNLQRARSVGLTNATAQGAQYGSGLQGGYGQMSGQAGTMLNTVQQNLGLGRQQFANNAQISQNRLAMSDLEIMFAQQRAASQTAKSQMAFEYAQANAGFQTRQADLDTFSAQGGGMVSQGQGYVNMGSMQQQAGNTYMQMGPQLFSMANTLGNVGQTNFGSMFGSNNSQGSYVYGAAGNMGVYTYT